MSKLYAVGFGAHVIANELNADKDNNKSAYEYAEPNFTLVVSDRSNKTLAALQERCLDYFLEFMMDDGEDAASHGQALTWKVCKNGDTYFYTAIYNYSHVHTEMGGVELIFVLKPVETLIVK